MPKINIFIVIDFQSQMITWFHILTLNAHTGIGIENVPLLPAATNVWWIFNGISV